MSTLLPRASIAPSSLPRVRICWERVGVILIALVALLWVLTGAAGMSQADTPPAPSLSVVVQPGDTLWDMARTHAPRGVPTLDFAQMIATDNGVSAGMLVPGSVLVLPGS